MRVRRKRKNRTGLYLVMLVVGIFLSTLIVQGIQLKASCEDLRQQQSQLLDKKEELTEEQQEIKERTKYMKTDQYIEDVAREKFGLVYDNEIIFKAADGD